MMPHDLIDPVIRKLEEELPKYLAGRRWYRAKAQTITKLNVSDIVQADGFAILVLKVAYGSGTEDLYLLPVTSTVASDTDNSGDEAIAVYENEDGNEVTISDAIHSPFFRTILFRALNSGANFPGRAGSLRAQPATHPVEVEGTLSSTVSRAEQSNTSIIFGREFILKLFRKIEPGINPDIEIGAFLTAKGFKHTPAVVGSLEYQPQTGEACSAGVLQKFVVNRGDAWKYTLDSLGDFYTRALKSTLDDPALLGSYADAASLLGLRTAQMHATLAMPGEDPAFTPEPFTKADAISLADEIDSQAKSALTLLREKAGSLPALERELASRVLELEPQIVQAFSLLPSISTQAKRIRHHGDYHLGQVLATGSDFMIIDFEGEPARPLSERRSKGLGLRDVAGMLRSFQYAGYAGLYGLVPGLPTDPESAEKIAECSAFWNAEVARLYLDAYFREAEAHDFVPETAEQRTAFLDAYLLQKALYEVQYELNNRPGWVGIPLRGILGLVDKGQAA